MRTNGPGGGRDLDDETVTFFFTDSFAIRGTDMGGKMRNKKLFRLAKRRAGRRFTATHLHAGARTRTSY